MASTVISGASNPSYRNNTDQNVRVVINYMTSAVSDNRQGTPFGRIGTVSYFITINWNGVSVSASDSSQFEAQPGRPQITVVQTTVGFPISIGRSIAATSGVALPTEIILAPGQTFSAVCGAHNIVVIPENG